MEVCALSRHHAASGGFGDHRSQGSHVMGSPVDAQPASGQQECC